MNTNNNNGMDTSSESESDNDYDDYDDIICCICEFDDDSIPILLCDDCDRGFHTECLGLNSVPQDSWYCPKCLRDSKMASKKTDLQNADKQKKAKKIQEVPKKVYIYERVSSKGQDDPKRGRDGLNTQNHDVLEYCIQNGLIVAETVEEVGSAFNTNTPKLNRLIKKVPRGQTIVVYSASRFSRNLDDFDYKIEKLHDKNCRVYSVVDNMDSFDKGFRALIRSAEASSVMLSTSVRSAYQRRKTQGSYTGTGTPFGYHRVKVNGLTKLKKNTVEQLIITKMKDLYKIHKNYNTVHEKISKKYSRYNLTPSKVRTILTRNIDKKYIIDDDDGLKTLANAIDEIEEEEIYVSSAAVQSSKKRKFFGDDFSYEDTE